MAMGAVSLPIQHIQPQSLRKTLTTPPSLSPSPFRWGSTSSLPSSSISCRLKIGDANKELDDLINKYGKVVYSNPDPPSSKSLDDDTEYKSLSLALAKIADEVKGEDTLVLYVKPLVYWTRFFVITTAFSNPQINAMSGKMRDLAEQQFGLLDGADEKPNSWTVLDFGEVVVHIFLPPQRAFYNLEEFYGNATPIELPFENRNTTQRPNL